MLAIQPATLPIAERENATLNDCGTRQSYSDNLGTRQSYSDNLGTRLRYSDNLGTRNPCARPGGPALSSVLIRSTGIFKALAALSGLWWSAHF